MELLEREIEKKGKVLPGNILKVGSFLNQQMDAEFVSKLAKEIYNHFKDKNINKILTVEASGIAFAILVAKEFKCKMVFAKKSQALNADGSLYQARCESFTRKTVNNITLPKEYLDKDDVVLIVDDFLAVGNAITALREIISQSGATLAGVTTIVEKGFQKGGDKLREEGIDLLSLAIVDKMEDGKITFRKN